VEVSPALNPAPQAAQAFGPEPEQLHPALWRASQLGRASGRVLPSGFAALDAALPGGGWPAGVLTELLLPHPGVGEWRLLAPALAALQRGLDGLPRAVMLFDPPARPCAWTLAALGLALPQLMLVRGRASSPPGAVRPARRPAGRVGPLLPAADVLWALEQSLASGQVGAALAWLPPRLGGDALRRLQLAAQAHPGPVFLFREAEAAARPSAAPLRLRLAPGAPDELWLRVFKRRGPPLADPLRLSLPPVLSASARARAGATRRRPAVAETLPA